MAHGERRQPLLCRAVDRFLSRPDRARHRRQAHSPPRRSRQRARCRRPDRSVRSRGDRRPCRRSARASGRCDRRGARASRRIPLQPKPRHPARRRLADAEAARGVVELELHRAACRRGGGERLHRHLLDEPAAKHRRAGIAFRDAQSAARARSPHRAADADLRSSDLRRRRDPRATPALVAARPAEHLVLRFLFRRRLSRGRAAIGPGRCRGARRHAASVERRKPIRPHLHRAGRAGTHPSEAAA